MEMNAYELAQCLEDMADFDECEYTKAAHMLRQQADRIAKLEGEVSHLKHINKNWSISEGLALQRITELEKDLKKYDKLAWDDLSNPKTIWCDCGDGITVDSGAKCGVCASTPQTKPLSDEEIDNICQEIACECQHIETDEWIYRIVARAIEAKVRGKK